MKDRLDESTQYLLEIMEMQNMKENITDMIKNIYDTKKLKMIYAYIKAIEKHWGVEPKEILKGDDFMYLKLIAEYVDLCKKYNKPITWEELRLFKASLK